MDKQYEKLHISPDCTDMELEESYRALKEQYSEDRFKEGEEGRMGAVNLSELEQAYQEIKAERTKQAKRDEQGGGDDLDIVDRFIKEGNLDAAQQNLDAMTMRSARWHYLQSIVFYKRNWFDDSRKQLQLAISLDPNNASYKRSLENLEKVMANGAANPTNMGGAQQGNPQPGPMPQNMDSSMGLANCCNTLCCASCCCDMLRCCS